MKDSSKKEHLVKRKRGCAIKISVKRLSKILDKHNEKWYTDNVKGRGNKCGRPSNAQLRKPNTKIIVKPLDKYHKRCYNN